MIAIRSMIGFIGLWVLLAVGGHVAAVFAAGRAQHFAFPLEAVTPLFINIGCTWVAGMVGLSMLIYAVRGKEL